MNLFAPLRAALRGGLGVFASVNSSGPLQAKSTPLARRVNCDTPPLPGNCLGTLVSREEPSWSEELSEIRSLTRYRRFLTANLLRAKDRGGICVPVRLRRVPSAAVAVKGLRFASMNARRACTLDRHPRWGWLAAMRRMSSSHVPHACATAAIRRLPWRSWPRVEHRHHP